MTSKNAFKNALGSVGKALGSVGKTGDNGFYLGLEKYGLKGLKIADLARQIGVSKSSLSHFLKGRIDKCGKNSAQKIKNYLDNISGVKRVKKIKRDLAKQAFIIYNGEIILNPSVDVDRKSKKKWDEAIESIARNQGGC